MSTGLIPITAARRQNGGLHRPSWPRPISTFTGNASEARLRAGVHGCQHDRPARPRRRSLGVPFALPIGDIPMRLPELSSSVKKGHYSVAMSEGRPTRVTVMKLAGCCLLAGVVVAALM